MTARDIVMSAAGNAGDGKTYIEDVFSTYLYTGTGASQTITNGIDLSGKGGMVWVKSRTSANFHNLWDTVRGNRKILYSNYTGDQATDGVGYGLTSFNDNGFSLGPDQNSFSNASGQNYASWTFRKAPKFFDVVTYTGTGGAQTLNHSLGSVPGMIIVKCLSIAKAWSVYHHSTGTNYSTYLNSTLPGDSSSVFWNNTAPTSTQFTVGLDNNNSGATFVAYLFAHDTTTDGLIQCGSYVGTGAEGLSINLGWEPQYVLIKNTYATSNWSVYDNMRGVAIEGNDGLLFPNITNVEETISNDIAFNATGFTLERSTSRTNTSGQTCIYMAIRRGPMRTPTDGTKVFSPVAFTGDSTTGRIISSGFPVDLLVSHSRNTVYGVPWLDRIRGAQKFLFSSNTNAEETKDRWAFDQQNGVRSTVSGADGNYNDTRVNWMFRRAPGFFDVVYYTGTGAARTVNHNLGVAPELMIAKRRNGVTNWPVYSSNLGYINELVLNFTDPAGADSTVWYANPSATTFSVGTSSKTNASGGTYVAYLFASCPGVSKVGSYTGNGTSQTINCGFANGARFVMIKRTSGTGDWYVWDTARGMVSGTNPYLRLNLTNAEVYTNAVFTIPEGFNIVAAGSGINAADATYIYLAIA